MTVALSWVEEGGPLTLDRSIDCSRGETWAIAVLDKITMGLGEREVRI